MLIKPKKSATHDPKSSPILAYGVTLSKDKKKISEVRKLMQDVQEGLNEAIRTGRFFQPTPPPKRRPPLKWRKLIIRDPKINGGKPTIRGTRVLVEKVAADIDAGEGAFALCAKYKVSFDAVVAASCWKTTRYVARMLARDRRAAARARRDAERATGSVVGAGHRKR